jgi:hypothetical protein
MWSSRQYYKLTYTTWHCSNVVKWTNGMLYWTWNSHGGEYLLSRKLLVLERSTASIVREEAERCFLSSAEEGYSNFLWTVCKLQNDTVLISQTIAGKFTQRHTPTHTRQMEMCVENGKKKTGEIKVETSIIKCPVWDSHAVRIKASFCWYLTPYCLI